MAEKKKGFGDALIDLFVVRPGSEAEAEAEAHPAPTAAQSGKTGDATVDDLISRYAQGGTAGKAQRSRPPGPPTPAAAAPSGPATAPTAATDAAAAGSPRPPLPEVAVDFPAVLRRAGLSDEEQARVDKALTLLHNLPAETPVEVKRQIVGASLQAFAIPVDQIVESALLHISAYQRHIQAGQAETKAVVEQATRRLAELEQEAALVRQSAMQQEQQQEGLTYACTRQKVRAQEILDFFGPEAVTRVEKSSIKLRNRKDS